MKLSIDSTDPLEDAIRVLGAMYNVTLVTPSNNTAKKASAPATESTRNASGRVGTAELRSWAREHGFTVSDRGRIPAVISAAYSQASNN